MQRLRWALPVVIVGALAAPGAARAQDKPAYPTFKLGGRMQLQAYAFDDDELAGTEGGASGPSSNFVVRRARFEVLARVSDRVSFVVMPSYEAPRNRVRLRDAFVDVRLTPEGEGTSLVLRAGQEKRPFGRYELLSSNNLPSIERGAGSGLASSTATHNLFELNGFLSHDVGVAAHAALPLDDQRTLRVQAGLYNGQGESFNDINAAKSWAVRATVDVIGKLSLGASYADHETAQLEDPDVTNGPVGPTVRNQAVGLDLMYGAPGNPGLLVIGDWMSGEDTTTARTPIRGAQALAAWHFRLARPRALLYAIEPVVRADWATADADDANSDVTLLTAGVGLYFSPRTHWRIVWERQHPADDARQTVSGVRTMLSTSF
ncbi:MAG TPA: porin [Gemmatimonadales bacterium]|nr:porin [Gemmatimonadales bacterium]